MNNAYFYQSPQFANDWSIDAVSESLSYLLDTLPNCALPAPLHTSTYNCNKDKQNARQIPIAGHFKLIFCPFYAGYFENQS